MPRPPKPPAAHGRCPTCGDILPVPALRGVLQQIARLRSDLSQPRPDDEEPGRFARLRMVHVMGVLDILLEDEASFCFGHEPAKRGPRPKTENVDPSNPPGLELPNRRRKPGPPPLQAVPDDE